MNNQVIDLPIAGSNGLRKPVTGKIAPKSLRSSAVLRNSRVLSILRSGCSAGVFKVNLLDPRVIEIYGMVGADAVWLCNEHVSNDWTGIENQIRAARVHDMDTIVRVAKGSYSDYIKPFESGATGIMVPHVGSAEEARQIVEWTRCRPIGRRALDGGNIDGAFCQVPFPEYLDYANTEQFVILQIESPEALEQVEKIAAVPGYDILLFGAGDFSHLIDRIGQLDDPRIVAGRKRVAAAARAHGKWAMSAGLPISRGELELEGYSLFSIGSDILALVESARGRLSHFADGETEANSAYYRK